MNSTKIHHDRTDIAWNRLAKRLEKDGLLPQEHIKQAIPSKPNYLLALAAVAVVIVTTLTLFLDFGKGKLPDKTVITNSEDQAISVTTLSDGSTVYMAQNSSISLAGNFSAQKREISLSGDAFFDVASNPESPFKIEASSFTIEVPGTSFLVNHDSKGNPAVVVESGKVLVRLKKTGEQITLSAGQSTSIQNDSFYSGNGTSAKKFMDKTSKLHFKDQKLKDVAKVLSKRYPGTTLIISPETEERIITATFLGESLLSETQMICKVLQLRYTQTEQTITVHE